MHSAQPCDYKKIHRHFISKTVKASELFPYCNNYFSTSHKHCFTRQLWICYAQSVNKWKWSDLRLYYNHGNQKTYPARSLALSTPIPPNAHHKRLHCIHPKECIINDWIHTPQLNKAQETAKPLQFKACTDIHRSPSRVSMSEAALLFLSGCISIFHMESKKQLLEYLQKKGANWRSLETIKSSNADL